MKFERKIKENFKEKSADFFNNI